MTNLEKTYVGSFGKDVIGSIEKEFRGKDDEVADALHSLKNCLEKLCLFRDEIQVLSLSQGFQIFAIISCHMLYGYGITKWYFALLPAALGLLMIRHARIRKKSTLESAKMISILSVLIVDFQMQLYLSESGPEKVPAEKCVKNPEDEVFGKIVLCGLRSIDKNIVGIFLNMGICTLLAGLTLIVFVSYTEAVHSIQTLFFYEAILLVIFIESFLCLREVVQTKKILFES